MFSIIILWHLFEQLIKIYMMLQLSKINIYEEFLDITKGIIKLSSN